MTEGASGGKDVTGDGDGTAEAGDGTGALVGGEGEAGTTAGDREVGLGIGEGYTTPGDGWEDRSLEGEGDVDVGGNCEGFSGCNLGRGSNPSNSFGRSIPIPAMSMWWCVPCSAPWCFSNG